MSVFEKVPLIRVTFLAPISRTNFEGLRKEVLQPPKTKSFSVSPLLKITHNVGLHRLFPDLQKQGYCLVDASYVLECLTVENPYNQSKRTIHRVDFQFRQENSPVVSSLLDEEKGKAEEVFQQLCRNAMWRVQGQRSQKNNVFSLVLDFPIFLLRKDGGPVMRNVNDENGRETGTQRPLQSKRRLVVTDGGFDIIFLS